MKHPKALKIPSFPHAFSGNPVTLLEILYSSNSLALCSKSACGMEACKRAVRRTTALISAKTAENPLPRFGTEDRQLVTDCHRLKITTTDGKQRLKKEGSQSVTNCYRLILPSAKSSYFHFGTNCQRMKSKITEANRVSQAGMNQLITDPSKGNVK